MHRMLYGIISGSGSWTAVKPTSCIIMQALSGRERKYVTVFGFTTT